MRITPVPTAAAELGDCWLYITYRVVSHARRNGMLVDAADLAAIFTAVVRSLVARDPRARRPLSMI